MMWPIRSRSWDDRKALQLPTCFHSTGRRWAHARRRIGLSLLEMMLVLAVLVAAAAIALPALQGPMSDQRLRKAADLVLAQWSRARLEAMKTGQMQVFRYEIGTEYYQVQPRFDGSFLLEGSADADRLMAPDMLQNPGQDGRDSPLGVAGQRLPSGATFFTGRTDTDARMMQLQSEDPNIILSGTAAQPIVFYPDGTATQAVLVLTNERFFVQLRLRGLTGSGRASGLLTLEEIEP
jgi:type II secretory pathway pseudopilin PulG